jgi:hypothetical protein
MVRKKDACNTCSSFSSFTVLPAPLVCANNPPHQHPQAMLEAAPYGTKRLWAFDVIYGLSLFLMPSCR